MAQVHFTPHLRRFLSTPPTTVPGTTVSEVLEAVFVENPRLAGYLVDDQGRLRKHVAVFVDGDLVRDRLALSDPVGETGEIYVMQALSGG